MPNWNTKQKNKKKKRVVQILKLDLQGFEHEQRQVYTIEGQILNQGDFELLQFTGLIDINGEEIYEGDILEDLIDTRRFRWLVAFKNGCFGIQNIGVDNVLGDFYPIDSKYFFKDRIRINSIYENPELMEVAK